MAIPTNPRPGSDIAIGQALRAIADRIDEIAFEKRMIIELSFKLQSEAEMLRALATGFDGRFTNTRAETRKLGYQQIIDKTSTPELTAAAIGTMMEQLIDFSLKHKNPIDPTTIRIYPAPVTNDDQHEHELGTTVRITARTHPIPARHQHHEQG